MGSAHLSDRVFLGRVRSGRLVAASMGAVERVSRESGLLGRFGVAGLAGPVLATILGVVVLAVIGWPGWWHVGIGVRRPDALGDLLATGEAVALLVWRRWPAGCLAVAQLCAVGYGLLGFPATPSGYAGLVATGLVAWRATKVTVRYGAGLVAAAGVVVIATIGPRPASAAAIAANLLLVVVAWLVGTVVRSRQSMAASAARVEVEQAPPPGDRGSRRARRGTTRPGRPRPGRGAPPARSRPSPGRRHQLGQ